MKTRLRLGCAALVLALAASPLLAFAQEDQFPEGVAVGWIKDGAGGATSDVRPRQATGQTLPQTLPMTPARQIDFTTHTGTWMSLDVSPDGKSLVFDMLGDLYRIDTKGGKAKPLRTGPAFDSQPVISPDGQWIAFISDASGADNLWVMKADGSAARQISFGEDDTNLVSPEWAKDGKSVFLERYRPSYNAYELWNYTLDDTETIIVPVKGNPDPGRGQWLSSLGAVPSPDGKALVMARHVGSTDPDTRDEWRIVRRDLASGSEDTLVTEPDGSGRARNPGAYFRPVLSPDGHVLAYAMRENNQTWLHLRNLDTGADRTLAFPVTHDQVQANSWLDLLPRYTFSRDGKSLYLTLNGGFSRVDVATGKADALPFTADVHLSLGALSRQVITESPGPVHAHLIQTPQMSPDGKRLVFSALGAIYVMPLDGSDAPKALTTGADPAWQPSWSPDGQRITYVTWTAEKAGDVFSIPADGTGAPVRISRQSDYYTYPVFTPDGQQIIAERSAQRDRLRLYMEFGALRTASLVRFPIAGGDAQPIGAPLSIGGRPTFESPTLDRKAAALDVQTDAGLSRIDLGTGKRVDLVSVVGPGWYFQDGPVDVDQLRLSPDGKWILAQVAQQLHVVAMPPPGKDGKVPVVDLSDPKLPHRRLTASGADFFEWSADGQTITYALGSTFYTRPLSGVVLNTPDHPSWSADPGKAVAYHADVTVPRDVPHQTLVLRGALALPMDRPAITDADIVITDNRITAIGAEGSIAIPAGAVIRDVHGKTVMPGFVDTHDHIGTVRRDVLDMSDWSLRSRLAYGVTTSFDPSTLSIDMVAYKDLLDAGRMLGPRLPSTGTAIFSFNRFSSYEEVLAVLRRYRDDYGLHNIKEYRTGDRKVRQWVNMACLQLGLQPTTEGALSLKLDLTQIMDGYSGNEHALVAFPLYDDVIQLLAKSHTSYTTTLQITNGGASGQDYFIAEHDPGEDTKFQHFTPPFAVEQMTTRLDQWMPLSQYVFPTVAKGALDIAHQGGLVGVGAHGNTPGVGFHFEMEAHVLGGWTPEEVLHAATLGSAETIGRVSEIGSLTPGKFADLLILDADPRTDINNAWKISEVMKNGRLYRASDLSELFPDPSPAPTSLFAGQQP
jgi:Tol biopolymer transport system component